MSKKFYRIRKKGKICGVCAGVAEYFRIDVDIVRILWAVLAVFNIAFFVLYLVAAFVLPDRDSMY